MKNIKDYTSEKYKKTGALINSEYEMVDEGIYRKKKGNGYTYVTSLSFVQEPQYGEGVDSSNISQYPLEDILDKYFCYISDFYEELNSKGQKDCYLEFASDSQEDVTNLREIIGKHVYNKEVKENNKVLIKLIIK